MLKQRTITSEKLTWTEGDRKAINSSKQLSSTPEANNETSPRPSTKATRLPRTFLFYDNIFQKREESREATPKLQSY